MKKNCSVFILMLFAITFCRSQSIVSVSPSTAAAGQTLNVTITGSGTHFVSGSSTLRFGFKQCSGTVVNSMNVSSNSSLSANITVPVNAYNNLHDVEVFSPTDGYVGMDHVFDINSGIPYQVALFPNSAAPGQTLNVTITGNGTHFMQGSSSTMSINLDLDQRVCQYAFSSFIGIPSSNTAMTSTFTIPPGTDTGYYDITISGSTDNLSDLQNLFHVTGPIGMPELENGYHLEIYPNPFSSETFLNYSLSQPETVCVEVYDLFGRKILVENSGKQKPGSHSVKIDAAGLNLESGIYYIKFSAGNKNLTKKILLNR